MKNIESKLKTKYRPTNVFRGIDTESIKEDLGLKLNNRQLNKIITSTFEDVKIRGDGFNKKYFLELI